MKESEWVWSEHALKRAEERFPGVPLTPMLNRAKILKGRLKKQVRKDCPKYVAEYLGGGKFKGRYTLHHSGIVFGMQAPNIVITVFKIGTKTTNDSANVCKD
jgi:hypothetical protein